MIIGLTGKNCAGKDTVAEYLKTKSFYHTSLSDIIREDLIICKKPITRENLISYGNELRKIYGAGVLADLTLKKIEQDESKNYVVSSIRNVHEIKSLKKNPDFFLFDVDAPVEIRFNRMLLRNREKDPKTLEEFIAADLCEDSTNSIYQQISKCQEIAEVHIINDSTVEDLYLKTDAALNSLMPEIAKRFKRPSWDEYFVNITKVVASRSNCMKRKVGAVIARDKVILSTGYNGTPKGTKNCYEGGCPRCNNFAKSGSNRDECLCVHAEINAVVQAANRGVNINGATIYTSFSTCLDCAKALVNAGIKEIVYHTEYPTLDITSKLLEEAKIKLRKFEA